jgi:hypothetical protein
MKNRGQFPNNWVIGCTGKLRYTPEDAKTALARMQAKEPDKIMKKYKCHNCGHYHVGTKR